MDEVHMLSQGAVNAFLKTLEEQGMIETDGKAILIFDVTPEETDVSLDKDDDEE
jgi:CRP/FNR family cyclic AMP-dependent transcriptional regulator